MNNNFINECKICLYNDGVNGVNIERDGICNYCRLIEKFKENYKTGTLEGEKELNKIIEEIKRKGKNKKYDCIVGVSGGTDSSYLLVKLIEWGLRPLAVHYDNTWNSAIATENINVILNSLNVDLFTYVVNNKEVDDITLAFMKAAVPELDASTDLALADVIYRAAKKFKLKYVFEGHSFMTEGISPVNNVYFDGKYIKSIHKKFGKLKMKTYPLMTLSKFLKYTLFYRIQKIRPYWYIHYSKEEAIDYLERNFGWKYYGGHHLENRLTAFNHNLYFKKFGINLKSATLGAKLRQGLINKTEARIIFDRDEDSKDLKNYFIKRLNLSEFEYDQLMSLPNKNHTDYPTYKQTFELLRPLFYLMMKSNLVTASFYEKYCVKSKR